ncbi:recombinase family protein [Microbacterium hydrocarbonoxydans]|uniref:recombinase family protein n=1 Tax=Microbacterium hydrocarbonoxydans TaxID=273678 RepID=UPI003D96F829
MTKRAALYLRQSKSDEEGIERQEQRTRALVELRGWTVGEVFIDDDVSASKPRGAKTAWGRMLASAAQFDVAVAVDLDRIVRSTRDLNTLIDHGLALVTVDGEIDLSTADGEFRGSMLAAIARFEVRRKGERQTRANGQRAARGGVPKGTRLTGYTSAGEIVPEEAVKVAALFDGFARGETLRSLSRDHTLTPSTVRTILTNARYAGRRVYLGQVVGKGEWEPIVSESLFDLVNARLADPARVSNRTGSTARKHLGTSLFLCGECTEPTTVRTAGSGNRYWCKDCGLVRTMAPVDDLVLGVLHARLSQPDALEALTPGADVDTAREEREALRARRSGLAALVADGTLGADEVRDAAATIDARLAELANAEHPVAAAVTPEEVEAGVAELSLDRQRALIDMFMEVRLRRVLRGRRGFDPESVEITWKAGTR